MSSIGLPLVIRQGKYLKAVAVIKKSDWRRGTYMGGHGRTEPDRKHRLSKAERKPMSGICSPSVIWQRKCLKVDLPRNRNTKQKRTYMRCCIQTSWNYCLGVLVSNVRLRERVLWRTGLMASDINGSEWCVTHSENDKRR